MVSSRLPLISVVVPTFNRGHLLARAVDSVLAQTHIELELLIVDDGSSDDTAAIVSRYRDPRVRYVRQERSGAAAARNRGAALAHGNLLTFLDSDDEAAREWLRSMAEQFDSPSVAIAFCGTESRNEAGTILYSKMPFHLGPLFNDWVGQFNDGAFVVRRDVFEGVEGYEPSLLANQHSELGFRIVDYCDCRGLERRLVFEPLVIYHEHAGARIRSDSEAVLGGTLYLLEHHRTRIERHPPTFREYLAIAGTHAGRLGRKRLARALFFEALKSRPASVKNLLRWLRSLAMAF